MSTALAFQDWFALTQLSADYASTVDAADWDGWCELFTDDCVYRLVPRENHERGLPLATLSFESKGMLKDRAYAIRETLFHDPYYQRHVVGVPRVLHASPERIECESNYAVLRTKLSELSTVFNVGRYLDTVVRTPQGLKFASRVCVYDSELIPNSIIYPIEDIAMSIEWSDAAAEADLWDGAGTSVLVRGRDIAIFRVGDATFATDNLCTHGHARLCDGFVEGFEIECPLHQGRFDLRTGMPTCAPPVEAVKTYPVRIEGGRVYLSLA